LINTKSGVINRNKNKNDTYRDSRGGEFGMKKQYVTATELMETLGVSKGKAYKIIRDLNDELAKQGYIKIAGKCPRKYFEEKYYGYVSQE
jgi:predicted HTH transcriptional regulator